MDFNLKLVGAHPVGTLVKAARLTVFPAELYCKVVWITGLTGVILSVNTALKQGSTVIVPVFYEVE